jgi:2-hydroxychromene-2-carboxylate isomerase
MFGALTYTVTDEKGSRTSRNRDQVLSTLTMNEVQVRTWVADQGAWLEGRSVTFNQNGHTETISRGMFGALTYTVTDEKGSRTSSSRTEVLRTIGMTEAQVRDWAVASAGVFEGRSATINQSGHTETISRGMFGIVQYTVTDEKGSRTSRNRDQVLSTLTMSEAQVRVWAAASAGVLEGRSATINKDGHTETISRGMFGALTYTVMDEKGSRTGRNRDQVLSTLTMSEAQVREWAVASGGLLEGRSVTINALGHNETISRGMFGALTYTVADEKGSRTGRNRDQVLSTLTMSEAQVREWAVASGSLLDGRSVTINALGHNETISRGMFGALTYTVTDEKGSRTGTNRESVLATLTMNEAQVRAWVADGGAWLQGRSVTINQNGHTESISRGMFGTLTYTVTDEKGSRTGRNRDQVLSTLTMTEAQMRTWVASSVGVLEGRSVTFNKDGHTETVSRGTFGALTYTVTDEKGSRTGRNRDQVLSTLTMSEAQVRVWVADRGAWLQGRSVTINKDGHTETISRGGMFNQLQYTVTDEKGSRTGTNRESVLATLTMNETQLKQWASEGSEARSITINELGQTVSYVRSWGLMGYSTLATVSNESGSVTHRNVGTARAVLAMGINARRAWVNQGGEYRSITINENGQNLTLTRSQGFLEFSTQATITNDAGSVTCGSEAEARRVSGLGAADRMAWAGENVWETRSVTINEDGRSLTVSRSFGLLGFQTTYTATDETGSVTANSAAVAREVLGKGVDERRTWARANVSESRSVTINEEGRTITLSRSLGVGGYRTLTTVANDRVSVTHADEAKAKEMADKTPRELEAWATSGSEYRSVTLIGSDTARTLTRTNELSIMPSGRYRMSGTLDSYFTTESVSEKGKTTVSRVLGLREGQSFEVNLTGQVGRETIQARATFTFRNGDFDWKIAEGGQIMRVTPRTDPRPTPQDDRPTVVLSGAGSAVNRYEITSTSIDEQTGSRVEILTAKAGGGINGRGSLMCADAAGSQVTLVGAGNARLTIELGGDGNWKAVGAANTTFTYEGVRYQIDANNHINLHADGRSFLTGINEADGRSITLITRKGLAHYDNVKSVQLVGGELVVTFARLASSRTTTGGVTSGILGVCLDSETGVLKAQRFGMMDGNTAVDAGRLEGTKFVPTAEGRRLMTAAGEAGFYFPTAYNGWDLVKSIDPATARHGNRIGASFVLSSVNPMTSRDDVNTTLIYYFVADGSLKETVVNVARGDRIASVSIDGASGRIISTPGADHDTRADLAALLKDGDRYYAAYLPMGGQMTEVTMWRQPDRNYYTLERSDPLVFTNPSGNRTLITGYFINIGRDPAEDGVVETRGRIELAGSDTRISFWIDKNGQVNFGADERAKLPQLEGRNVVLPLGGQYQSVQVSRVTQNANEIDISFAEPVQVNVGSGLIAVSGLRIDKAGDYAGVSAYMASGTLESNRVGLAGFFANMHGFDASRATRTTASDTMIFRITNKGIQLIGGTTIRVEGVNMNGVTVTFEGNATTRTLTLEFSAGSSYKMGEQTITAVNAQEGRNRLVYTFAADGSQVIRADTGFDVRMKQTLQAGQEYGIAGGSIRFVNKND